MWNFASNAFCKTGIDYVMWLYSLVFPSTTAYKPIWLQQLVKLTVTDIAFSSFILLLVQTRTLATTLLSAMVALIRPWGFKKW